MSALGFILMLLVFITIPTLIYTIFHVIKCRPSSLPPPPPLAAAAKLELVTSVVDVAKLESVKEEARGDCSVCLSAFEDGEELWRLKHCSHLFHAPCIEPWLHARSSCPVCRCVVLPKPPKSGSAVVPAAARGRAAAAREGDLWQGLPDSAGLV